MYGDDFLIDKIQPDEISEELLSMGELEYGVTLRSALSILLTLISELRVTLRGNLGI